MTCRVLLFAGIADQIGAGELSVDVSDDATVAELKTAIAESFPDLEPWLDRVAFAVNMEYVKSDHPLSSSDEIALIPPVSGG